MDGYTLVMTNETVPSKDKRPAWRTWDGVERLDMARSERAAYRTDRYDVYLARYGDTNLVQWWGRTSANYEHHAFGRVMRLVKEVRKANYAFVNATGTLSGYHQYVFYMNLIDPERASLEDSDACSRAINEAFEWCREQFGPFPGGETGDAWNPRLGKSTILEGQLWFAQRGQFRFYRSLEATAFRLRWG